MIKRRTLLAAGLAAPALSACATSSAPDYVDNRASLPPLPHDRHSHARPDEARVLHVSLDLTANFALKILEGAATLTIAARPDAREIVLDIDGLDIRNVRTNQGETQWTIGQRRPELGAPLSIALRPGDREITIAYATSPDAGALQWLEPAQTASGKPFLFSQGQAILTRTWAPTQDSPGIRQTYDARIVAPEGLKAVMSAEMLTPNGEASEGGRAYRFRMRNPVPIYLMSLAIGDLEFGAVGQRTGVWAEPSVLQRGLFECADMEAMVRAAEALYGPYRWGRYDVLILPPSFPYGGMENPRLTFLTPTFLAGDRSLVSLIAHELAHSWSGNLVTNAVWSDSWLNEGFTTYFEGRITEALYGVERAAQQNVLAWAEIQEAIRTIPADSQRLHLPEERGAEDNSSAIVYEKGALFLRTLEREVGRPRFDAYLRSYFDRHAFQPMTTARFLADFRERVVQGDAALEQRLQLDAWAFEPGLPSNAEEPRAESFVEVAHFVDHFASHGGAPAAAPWETWGTYERQRYLQTLPRTLSRAQLDALESAFGLNNVGNAEVLFDWLSLALSNRYEPALAPTERFLTSMGRGKFVRPLYRALMAQGDWGQPHARRIYARARATYHPIVQGAVDRIVAAS
ncbi:MAG: M1 family metallopeptidase [Hyphomonadaceae bacterium]|nr:M1 family metallopeptidase [Hyphomonadaceae bacterium]